MENKQEDEDISQASQTLLDLYASDCMETDEEDEEIGEDDVFDESRLIGQLDEFVEEAVPPPKKKRSSRQASSTTAPQPKKARKNAAEPRRFSFSVTITLTDEDRLGS